MTHTLTPPLVTNTPSVFAPSIAKQARRSLMGGRARRVAAEPRLDLAAKGTMAYYAPRVIRRPESLTARHTKDVAAAKRARFTPDSASYSFQTEFQGSKIGAASPFLFDFSGFIFDINFALALAHI